jgi:hypothetical protein
MPSAAIRRAFWPSPEREHRARGSCCIVETMCSFASTQLHRAILCVAMLSSVGAWTNDAVGWTSNGTGDEGRRLQGAATCSDYCAYASDGECDDGGPGAEFADCSLGSDCEDCGVRYVVAAPTGECTCTDLRAFIDNGAGTSLCSTARQGCTNSFSVWQCSMSSINGATSYSVNCEASVSQSPSPSSSSSPAPSSASPQDHICDIIAPVLVGTPCTCTETTVKVGH